MRRHVLVALILMGALAIAAFMPHAQAKAAATRCTTHSNHYSSVTYGTGNPTVIGSGAGWARSVYDWDNCNGGSEFDITFAPNCHLSVQQYLIDPSGHRGGPLQLWDSGVGCTVSGNLQFQQNGSVAIWTSYGNKIWWTPIYGDGRFLWELRYNQSDHATFVGLGGSWLQLWHQGF